MKQGGQKEGESAERNRVGEKEGGRAEETGRAAGSRGNRGGQKKAEKAEETGRSEGSMEAGGSRK